ncbi:hypothetical protein D3C80_1558040 [compost metagenome]
MKRLIRHIHGDYPIVSGRSSVRIFKGQEPFSKRSSLQRVVRAVIQLIVVCPETCCLTDPRSSVEFINFKSLICYLIECFGCENRINFIQNNEFEIKYIGISDSGIADQIPTVVSGIPSDNRNLFGVICINIGSIEFSAGCNFNVDFRGIRNTGSISDRIPVL